MENNQKRENILNLALDATESELEKSEILSSGYNFKEKSWELIVKYSGEVDRLKIDGVEIVDVLLGGYAIVNISESVIDKFSDLKEVEYIEKPKRLYFSIYQGKAASCITQVQTEKLNLSGKGVLVAVIDSGIDYFHNDFRNEDGSTRIRTLWDQELEQTFSKEEIDQALMDGFNIVPSKDLSGHGTAVAAIAAGNGRESNGVYRGVAYESELIVVKLGTPQKEAFPMTTQVMRGINFAVNEALDAGKPLAVNLSFGNTYGSHEGNSLLETFIDTVSMIGRNVISIGVGNEGVSDGHTYGRFATGKQNEIMEVPWSVGEYETGYNIQLWKEYQDDFLIYIITPQGEELGPLNERTGMQTITFSTEKILVYFGEPSPYSTAQEIYFEFLPNEFYVSSGIWKFKLVSKKIEDGRFDFWMPYDGARGTATRFLYPVPDITLTIPAAAQSAISVGAYNQYLQSYADFSGRGYTRVTEQIKPDLSAPGVEITSAKTGGGYAKFTGTSFATPFVTGSAALLMEWGIVKENDPYLYGQKVKAYLIKGSKKLQGFDEWPNKKIGWGVLCVKDSLPSDIRKQH